MVDEPKKKNSCLQFASMILRVRRDEVDTSLVKILACSTCWMNRTTKRLGRKVIFRCEKLQLVSSATQRDQELTDFQSLKPYSSHTLVTPTTNRCTSVATSPSGRCLQCKQEIRYNKPNESIGHGIFREEDNQRTVLVRLDWLILPFVENNGLDSVISLITSFIPMIEA